MADVLPNPDDLALYREIKGDLLAKDMEGKFVLIKDGELVEVYDSYKEAYDDAVTRFKAPFLIKEVEKEEVVETL